MQDKPNGAIAGAKPQPVAWWNRPSTWGWGLLILAFAAWMLKGGKAAPAQEPPPVVKATATEAKTYVQPPAPAPQPQNSTTTTGHASADRQGTAVNGNGNTVNVTNTVNVHVHYHATPQPEPVRYTAPERRAVVRRVPGTPVSRECEDKMDEHRRTVARWEQQFSK